MNNNPSFKISDYNWVSSSRRSFLLQEQREGKFDKLINNVVSDTLNAIALTSYFYIAI